MTSQREAQLRRLAESYTAAWCSQNAASVAGFYSLDGSLRVNCDPTAVGRDAIAGVAQGFMAAFPDLKVQAGPGNAFTSAVLKTGGSEQTDSLPSHAAISTVLSINVNSNRASLEPRRQPVSDGWR